MNSGKEFPFVPPVSIAAFGLRIVEWGLRSSWHRKKNRMVLDCGSPLPLWGYDAPTKAPEGRRTPRRYRAISRQPIPFCPGMFSVAADVSRLKLLRLK